MLCHRFFANVLQTKINKQGNLSVSKKNDVWWCVQLIKIDFHYYKLFKFENKNWTQNLEMNLYAAK